jgi:diaminopimelate epimerase
MSLSFIKMNGAGNDFVVLDGRHDIVRLTSDQVKSIAARGNGTTRGCDQVIVMEASSKADVFMRIFNADGGEVAACGNATRCIAGILEDELQRLPVTIETKAGILQGLQKAYTPDDIEYLLVDMGLPRFNWKDIPLAMPTPEAAQKIEALSALNDPAFANMGNPHVVFFVRDEAALSNVDLKRIGPMLEHAKDIFPEGVNVSIASVHAAKDGLGHIAHVRVWERGAGLTKACGTAACAILAAAHARDTSVQKLHLWFEPEGYAVTVQMEDNGHILLGGPIETEFEGKLSL